MEIISRDIRVVVRIKKGLFNYENIEVLKNFNYTIKQGEIIAIMGEANSGKSTLVNVLSGRKKVDDGAIFVDGEVDYEKLKKSSEVICDFVSQKYINNESVYNNLVAEGKKKKINKFDIEKRIVELRDVLELEKIINKKISELDEISKIKVSVAKSMIGNPSIVYFDNALMGLNVVTKNVVLKLLKRINKEFKTTIVVASVDLIDIEKICKRVSVLKCGEIVVDGDFESVKEKYWGDKLVGITFNKAVVIPKGNFEIVEHSDYYLKVKIDFRKCNFASLITQFDVNSIVDINISSISLFNL